MKRAILFIGHGTRSLAGQAEFHHFLNEVEASLSTNWLPLYETEEPPLLQRCFLEFQEPDILKAVESLIDLGATDILCAPLLLFAAGHLKEDISSTLGLARRKFPGVMLSCLDAIGVDDAFIHVAVKRLIESGFTQSDHDSVILVGRGNRDQEAQDRFLAAAEHLRLKSGLRSVQVGYLAGSGTTLEHALQLEVRKSVDTVYVLPYLWFQGWLTQSLPMRIEKWKQTWDGNVRIVLTGHLGPDPLLAERFGSRVQLAIRSSPAHV